MTGGGRRIRLAGAALLHWPDRSGQRIVSSQLRREGLMLFAAFTIAEESGGEESSPGRARGSHHLTPRSTRSASHAP